MYKATNMEKNTIGLVTDVVDIFVSSSNLIFNLNSTAQDVLVLDSCCDEKISYHLIFKSVVFPNNKKCKNFIQNVIDNLSPQEMERLTVFDKKGNRNLIIDMSVYNKYQNFREVINTSIL